MKSLLIGCGSIAFVMAVIVVWIGVSLFPGFGGTKSSYHPFRSAKAKERYLRLYDQRAQRWPVASESMTVETSYGPTFVRISGPANALPLVLLHGAGGTSLHWIPNIKSLSQDYRTFAIDGIYGYGRSVYTRSVTSGDDFTEWLDQTLSALALEDRVNLVGLSYGGWQASQYALRFPERLNSVVLVAPAGTVLPLSAGWIGRALLSVVPHRSFTRSFLSWLMEDWARQDDSSRRLFEEEAEAVFLGARSFKLKRLPNPTVLTSEELQSLRVPTLFMVGENEKIYSADRAISRLREVAPQIEIALVPSAGHDLTVVQADMVNRLLLEFLQRP